MEGGERAAAAPTQAHRFGSGGGVGGSEFFICFTSRPSSSSMRIPSSKSLPSPGRADKYRDPAAAAPSLSASLSRRLKSSGSVKGGQSPATIPAGGGSRRKSCPFEAAEPSSPKVTCIGQVKVKTARMKKKKKVMRSASTRGARGGGEATFRRLEQRSAEGDVGDGGEERECLPSKNQRRVYLPLSSICDALRAFGSEFNCFLPCGGGGRSHCSSSAGAEREKGERAGGVGEADRVGEKRARGGGMGSCGAAFARWLMAVQESERVKRGEMVELVVEDVSGRGRGRELGCVGVVMDAEKGGLVAKEEWEGKQSDLAAAATAAAAVAAAAPEDDGETVCVPPPNALLLMRCRSDPVRMAALATRFWGSPAAARVGVEDDEEDRDEEDEADNKQDEQAEGHAVQGGEEPEKAAGEWHEGGAQASAAAIVAETVLKEDPLKMAEEESLGICNQHVVGGEGEMMLTQEGEEQQQQQPQHCQEKEERDAGNPLCAEAAPGMANLAVEEKEAATTRSQDAQVEKEAALMEKSELHLPAGEQEEAAGKEEVASKARKPTGTSSERHGRRPSLSVEKDEGRRCFSKEREGRRHSFSTEKDSRRAYSFRDKEGRRSSFSVDGDALRTSFCSDGEGRRRWSFSSEKEVRRPSVEPTAGEAAVVMEKKRKKKKKKEEGSEGEEAGETKEDAGEEARSFNRPTTTAVAEEGGGGAAGRRGEKREELPDCLLLMMYEPKLSMEVSRETWVCTSDFLRFRPHHHRQQPLHTQQPALEAGAAQSEDAPAAASDGGGAENRVVTASGSHVISLPHPSPPPPPPPPPAPAPPAAPFLGPVHAAASPTPAPPPTVTAKTPEQRQASAAAGAASSPYGPFGLTRCKSEPMRSSAKLEPDACFWKSRHRPIGAAGIGF